MSPADIPDPIKMPEQAEVRPHRLSDDTLLANRPEHFSGNGAMVDRGQIDHMSLPHGWKLSQIHHRDIGAYSFQQCNPPNKNDGDAAICFFYRGLPISPQASEDFRSILDKPPHVLDQSEKDKCSELLRDRADPKDFTMRKCATMDLNGKRVLILEGTFNEKQEDLSQLFIDADGTGKFVQEIFYQAPNGKGDIHRNLYGKYLPAAQDSFKSIIWKLKTTAAG